MKEERTGTPKGPADPHHPRVDPNPLLTIAVAAAVVLTGCLGAPSGPSAGDDNTTNDPSASGPDQSGEAGLDPRRGGLYTFDADVGRTVRWLNGSFSPEEACLPAACWTQAVTGNATHNRTLDLTGVVPADAPAVVNATLTWEGAGVDAVFLDLVTSDTSVYARTIHRSDADQTVQLRNLLARQPEGTVSLEVTYLTPQATQDASMDFTLRAEVAVEPRAVPARVPVEVPVPEDATGLTLTPVGDGNVTAMIWGPDDGYVGLVELTPTADTVPLGPGAPAGDYVVYVLEPSAGVTIRPAAGPAGTLQPLGIERVDGPGHDVPPDGEVTWTFDVETAPLGVGLWLGSDAGYTTWNATGVVSSPAGPVHRFDNSGIEGSSGAIARWSIGGPNLVEGTYNATFSADAHVGQVGHVLVGYVR